MPSPADRTTRVLRLAVSTALLGSGAPVAAVAVAAMSTGCQPTRTNTGPVEIPPDSGGDGGADGGAATAGTPPVTGGEPPVTDGEPIGGPEGPDVNTGPKPGPVPPKPQPLPEPKPEPKPPTVMVNPGPAPR